MAVTRRWNVLRAPSKALGKHPPCMAGLCCSGATVADAPVSEGSFGEQSHRRSGEGFDRSEDLTELLCTSVRCRQGLEGLQEVVGAGMLSALALSPRLSLSALWGGGTGEWSGQSHCWRPWESSLCAACPA